MHTESDIPTFVLEVIDYLKRNDYTSIRQIGPRLLRTQDGNRGVYVWLDTGSLHQGVGRVDVIVPIRLLDLAQRERCRVDVIGINDMRHILHALNVGVSDD